MYYENTCVLRIFNKFVSVKWYFDREEQISLNRIKGLKLDSEPKFVKSSLFKYVFMAEPFLLRKLTDLTKLYFVCLDFQKNKIPKKIEKNQIMKISMDITEY